MADKTHKVSVKVKEIDRGKRPYLALRQAMAEGEIGEEKFKVNLAVPGAAVLVEFPDADYELLTSTIVEAVIEIREGRGS